MESATENNRQIRLVRVKMCGKSAHDILVIECWGKPRLEQDKVSMYGFSFRFEHVGMSHR